ncbi:MAG: hypothetical protein R2750_04920 [Bacteroidales bacterium]
MIRLGNGLLLVENLLRYGDMVIFKTGVDHTFTWISSEDVEEESSIPKTEYFSYEEQADYLPVYVEFDEMSDVQEIAITAGGEIKGQPLGNQVIQSFR